MTILEFISLLEFCWHWNCFIRTGAAHRQTKMVPFLLRVLMLMPENTVRNRWPTSVDD